MKHKFSIIGVTDSWLKPTNVDSYTPENHNHEYDIRLNNKGGGVSLLISDEVNYIVRKHIKFDVPTEFNLVSIETINDSRKNIIVMLLYRPPKTSITCFNSSLQVILEELSKEHKQIFLMGDFNIDTCKPYRCGSSTQNFTNLLLSSSYFPLIDKPTRIIKKSATLLDNIHSNYCLDNCNCGILCTDLSDHFQCFV